MTIIDYKFGQHHIHGCVATSGGFKSEDDMNEFIARLAELMHDYNVYLIDTRFEKYDTDELE